MNTTTTIGRPTRISNLPAKSQRLERSSSCHKCGGSLLTIVRRGGIEIERNCAYCGATTFADVPDIAI